MQTAAVQHVIGKAGENLKGPLVDQEKHTVSFDYDFSIGGNDGASAQSARYADEVIIAQRVYAGFERLMQRVQGECGRPTAPEFRCSFNAELTQLQDQVKDQKPGSPLNTLWQAGNALHQMPDDKPGCGYQKDGSWYDLDLEEYRKQMAAAAVAMKS